MPQLVHDAASVIQIALFVLAVIAYVRRESIINMLVRRLAGPELPETPPLTAPQIKNKVLQGFGEELEAVPDLQGKILTAMGSTQCLSQREDRPAKLDYKLDWETFFRRAPFSMWRQCALTVAHPLATENITHIVVLPWPRYSTGRTNYDSFTSRLVETLGRDIIVDHAKESDIRDGQPLPWFGDAGGEAVAIFEPYEVEDGFLEKVVDHLRSVHGCDIKALVTFFKTNTREREIVKGAGMREIQVVKLDLAKEEV